MATKKRDFNILLEAMGEVSLSTKTIPSKKKYTRKDKHKGNTNDNNRNVNGY